MSDPKSPRTTSKPASQAAASHALMSKSPARDDQADSADGGDATSKMEHKRAHDAEEEKAAQLGIRAAAVSGAPAYVRPTNLRRSSHALQLFGLLFVITLLLFGASLAGMYSFYEKKIAPGLVRASASAQPAGGAAIPAAVQIDIPAETREQIASAAAKITELQKQIDALRDASATSEGRLRELAESVARQQSAQPKPAEVQPTQATDAKPDGEVAAVVPVSTPTTKELVLLKERNRLTSYADEAIATGSRKTLDLLIKHLTDPDYAHLRDAAYAEIQRVYYHLRFTIRIDPGYRLPVNEIFKDSGIREESDLKTEQLIKLLHEQKQAWQVRLRSAWLLGGRRTHEVSEALMKAVKEDPVLDVAKEAQLSLEQNVDRKFLLLDIPAIDEWWKSQKDDKGGKDGDGGKADAKSNAETVKTESSGGSKKKSSK
ncbi:MAG: hypothetical protein K1X78_04280 [Verrucomicrobiaceae bacterium]|nr:hypothetical protein [Verrucomicrobiaceae bacterium]